jgi:hypothetical protein
VVATAPVWSSWSLGKRYDYRYVPADIVPSPYRFWVRVEIRDKKTGKIHYRRGQGFFCREEDGNHWYPTRVNFRGRKLWMNQILTFEG